MASPEAELLSAPPRQLSLELPAPPASAETPLVPVRMVNEYTPRRFFAAASLKAAASSRVPHRNLLIINRQCD
jgi:hypothetical protein